MEHERQHYLNRARVSPLRPTLVDVVDPSTEESFTQLAAGGPRDVDRAVATAKTAFPSFARTSRQDWLELLDAVLSEYNKRRQDIAGVLFREIGTPVKFALERQSANILLSDVDFKTAVKKGVPGMLVTAGHPAMCQPACLFPPTGTMR